MIQALGLVGKFLSGAAPFCINYYVLESPLVLSLYSIANKKRSILLVILRLLPVGLESRVFSGADMPVDPGASNVCFEYHITIYSIIFMIQNRQEGEAKKYQASQGMPGTLCGDRSEDMVVVNLILASSLSPL